MNSAHPIFVGGMNRTGTSLLRQVLGSHPAVAIPPTEFEFFKRLPAGPATKLRDRRQLLGLADEVLAWPKVAGWNLPRSAVMTRLSDAEVSLRTLFLAILESYAETLGKRRIGDKSTDYERHLKVFDEWFGDDYEFVHAVRHPVTAFASARWYGGVERQLDTRIWACTWVASTMAALRRSRRRSGYALVRYEDLVADPERELRRLCATVSLTFDECMLGMAAYTEKENSSFTAIDAQYAGLVRKSDGVDRAARLSADELRTLKRLCGRIAKHAGYDMDVDTHLTSVDGTGGLEELLCSVDLYREKAQLRSRAAVQRAHRAAFPIRDTRRQPPSPTS